MDSVSNRIIGQILLGHKLLVSLLIRRSSPLGYLLGGCPIHQGKFNLRHPISAILGYCNYVIALAVTTYEGTEEVYSISPLEYFSYSSRGIGWVWYGRDSVMVDRW